MKMAIVYQDVIQFVDAACIEFVGQKVEVVASAIAPAAYSLLGVYVIIWGLTSMRGLIQEPITDMAVRMLKIAFIFGIALNVATYSTYVIQNAWDAPQDLANAIGGNSSGTVSSLLDSLLMKGFIAGKQMYDKGGILSGDFGLYIAAFCTWGITLAVTAYTCFLLILSKVALALLISVGPLFILSLLFQSTANFFNSWIQQITNYGMVNILIIAANAFVLKIFERFSGIAAQQQTGSIDQLIPMVASGIISCLVLAQITSIAAGLAGGVSMSSYGMGRLGLSVFSRPARDLASAGYRGGKQAAAAGTKKAARVGWSATGGRAYSAYKARNRNSISSN
ncbi:type IV secretion system protein [Glaciimonas sp. GG7]